MASKRVFIKENLFQTINSEASAYFLGLIQTDGNIRISKDGYFRMCLKLQEKDSSIVRRLSQELFGIDYSKLYHPPSIKSTHQSQRELSIYSKQIFDDLNMLGCVPNKTFIMEMPENLVNILTENALLAAHWFRGILDGDGCINISNGKPSIEIYGKAYVFLNQITQIVWSHTGLFLKPRQKKGSQDGIRITGISNTQQLLSWIYNSASIFLPRKNKKALEILCLAS